VGSGKGKTAGRGHKGSHARNSRGLKPWFIGGQTPLYKLIPKRGFKAHLPRILDPVNLDRLTSFIQQRRIDPSKPITIKTMYDSGLISKPPKFGVKLLARGYRFPSSVAAHAAERPPLPAMRLEVSDASESAKKAVEEAGGEVKLVWHNRLGLRYLLKPEKFAGPPRAVAIPPPRWRKKYAEQRVGGQRSKSKMGDVV
jgi:large subunit ribosomal protein L15